MTVFSISRAGNASPAGRIGYTSGGMDGAVLDNLGGVATPLISSLAPIQTHFFVDFCYISRKSLLGEAAEAPRSKSSTEEYFFRLHICIK